jgi:uncharacterized protein (DUF58 family)
MIPKEIIKKVKKIEIKTRSLVDDVFGGEYHSIFKGQGIDFAEVRSYVPGDDIRTIDWNVTARTGSLHVKRYEEERELTVMLLLDMSTSARFGTFQKLKIEYVAEIAAILAFSAIKNNDKVGVIIFTDKVEKYIPPKKGKKHVLRVITEILSYEPSSENTSIIEGLDFLNRVLRRKSVCFLISDFFSEGYEKSLKIAASKNDLVAIRVIDRREVSIPESCGILCFEDAETGEDFVLDTSDRVFLESYFESSQEEMNDLEKKFQKMNVDLIQIIANENYLDPLVKFFKMRSKKIRH